MSAFSRLPREEQQRRAEYISRRHGCSVAQARDFLGTLDGTQVLCVGIDTRLAQPAEKPYDPSAEMFILR